MPPWEKYQSGSSPGPWSRYETQGAPSAAPEPLSDREAWESSMPVRALRGIEGPAITLLKMVGPDSIKQQLTEIDALRESGMKKRGNEGFDWAGLAGSLVPGTAIGSAVTKALPAALPAFVKGGVAGAAAAGAQPLQGRDELSTDKLEQMAVGGAIGAAIPPVAQALKWAGGKIHETVEPLYESGRAAILRRFQESKLPEGGKQLVIDALSKAKELVPGSKPTAGEALADIPEAAALAAHQKTISKIPTVSHEFAKHEAAQESARAAALRPIAGTADTRKAAIDHRALVTDPMREASLTRANVAGVLHPELNKTISKAERGVSALEKRLSRLDPKSPKVDPDALKSAVEIHGVPQKPLPTQKELLLRELLPEQIAARQSEITSARQALDTLAQQGMKPLTAKNLMAGLRARLNAPEIRASDVASNTLRHLEEKLEALKSKSGTIDAFDLYMVRRELGNNIQKFAKESNTFDKRFTSGLLRDAQGAIDEAIEQAGGRGWREYLAKYQELSAGPNQMKAGQELQSALRNTLDTAERGPAFAKAAGEVEPNTFTPQQQSTVDNIVRDLSRRDAFERLAKKTNLSGQDAIPGQITPHLPNLLSRPAMVANAIMKFIGESGEEKIAKLASKQYRDPQEFIKAFSQKDPETYKKILDAIMTHSPGPAATVAGRNY